MPRILAFTDTHGRVETARALAARLGEGAPDAVVCAGDFSFFGRRCGEWLAEIDRIGVPVHFVPGNHESARFAREVAAAHPLLRDVSHRTAEWGGLRIAGIPGAREYAHGAPDDPGPVGLALDLWGALDRARPLVFLTHYPPSACAVDGRSGGFAPDAGGSRVVRKIVEKLSPAVVICGHYHGDFGKTDRIGDARLVNPGPDAAWIEV